MTTFSVYYIRGVTTCKQMFYDKGQDSYGYSFDECVTRDVAYNNGEMPTPDGLEVFYSWIERESVAA